MIDRLQLEKYYITEKKSVKEVSEMLGCSVNKVIYWMDKYQIIRRTISEAIYQKHNPEGDPFSIKSIYSIEHAKLLGIGLGLYWVKAIKQISTQYD